MFSIECNQCHKIFTKETEEQARAALAMHNGRVHSARIRSLREKTGQLSMPQAQIVEFIRNHHQEYATQTDCLAAALKALNAENELKICSPTASRYYRLAGLGRKKPQPHAKTKKAVVRQTSQPQAPFHPAPAQTLEVRFNYCPVCGCRLQHIAQAMAAAECLR